MTKPAATGTHETTLAQDVALAWLALGVVYAAYQWTLHPNRARETERIFVDDEVEAEPRQA